MKIELGPSGRAVAANTHRLRTAQNLTWTMVSDRLTEIGRPINPVGLRRIEAGDRRVDADDLVALALVLGVGPATLLLPPDAEGERDPVQITGLTKKIAAGRVWEWLRSNMPLPPTTEVESVQFMVLAYPAWHDFGRAMVNLDARTGRITAKKERIHGND